MKKLILLAVILLAFSGVTVASATRTKINICHYTESQERSLVAIQIDDSALQTHLAHGDFIYGGDLHHGKPKDKGWCKNNEPVDLCNNIDGKQLHVPEGKIRDDKGNCINKAPEPTPTPVPTPAPQPVIEYRPVSTSLK